MRNGRKSPIISSVIPRGVLPGLEGTRVIARKRKRNAARIVALAAARVEALLLALFFMLGAGLSLALVCRCREQLCTRLGEYVTAYFSLLPQRGLTARGALGTLWVYLRGTVLAFTLGFCSLGVAALPLLCMAQGFLLGFALFGFAAVLGRSGFALTAALFTLRLLTVPPCTLLCAVASMEASRALAGLSPGKLRRTRGGAERARRFGRCCLCLLCACALELWLLPGLTAWLAERLGF